jgi:predicted O-methyltransferase YrrM
VSIEEDNAIVEGNKVNCSWFISYGMVSHLIELTQAKSVVEIGVAYGYHAEFILKHSPHIDYTGIDPYKFNYDPNDLFCADVQKLFGEKDGQLAMNRLHNAVQQRLLSYPSTSRLIREKSVEASLHFLNHSVDLVYIDGDHTYESVINDLNAWWNKVSHNTGLICGDDYCWEGVKRACDDFFNSKGVTYQLLSQNGREDYPIWFYDFSKSL